MGSDTVTYSVCVNQPGYLPESDPFHAQSLHEAREYAASIVRDALEVFAERVRTPEALGLTSRQIADVLMGAYDLGPDGGYLWLPDDSGYLVDVQPVW